MALDGCSILTRFKSTALESCCELCSNSRFDDEDAPDTAPGTGILDADDDATDGIDVSDEGAEGEGTEDEGADGEGERVLDL